MPNFYIGNMIPTCVNDDLDAARAINRRTLSSYALLPNYRNYWREAGYAAEMDAVERCIADNRLDQVGHALSDQWLDDTTIAGPASAARERTAALVRGRREDTDTGAKRGQGRTDAGV